MSLSDDEILKILIEYITDDRYKQAILIDGQWGSGKTFFVEEKLLSKLENDHSGRSVFYISLYGLNDYTQIMDEIYTVAFKKYFDKKLGNGVGEKVEKGMTFASKICSVGLKYFNVDTKELPSLSEMKQVKDAIIIFDDLERCNIDVNELLGFINNLVEHNNIKVIIVANQAEIGRIGISRDLPQKYLIALDSRIVLAEEKLDKKGSNVCDTEPINKEQLISRTDKLFFEDIRYKTIKEKLIGLTIHYQADFETIYECILEKHVREETVKLQLKNSKQVILDIFEKKKHRNIRTLIFGIMAYEKFCGILDSIVVEDNIYLKNQKEKILKYTMELSIRIKSGMPSYSWKTSNAKTGMVYWGKSVWGESMFGYKFVDNYLLHRHLNGDEIKETIISIIAEEKEVYDNRDRQNALLYNKLYSWWELEDEQITELLLGIQAELATKKYHPNYFKDMIVKLIQMEYDGLKGIVYDDYIPLMKIIMEDCDVPFERSKLEVLSSDKDFLNRYNTLAQPLFYTIDQKVKASKEEYNYFLVDSEPWDEKFVSKCEANKSVYISDKKFFFYIDPDKVIQKLEVSSVKEIYCFSDGIGKIYDFSNLDTFFMDDTSNIHSLLDKIDLEQLSQSKHTRKKALQILTKQLQESLELIEK